MSSVKVRFPPSPTGYCHVGTARMAALNFLFARKHGGTIVFRSEDTDRARSTKEFEDDIIEQLHWLGISWDTFYRSSEQVARHTEAMRRMIEEDRAFISREESKSEAGKMVEVVRLRNPGKTITFTDEIRGEISMDTSDLGDFVIGRAIDDPLYQLAVVVDDAADGITHVIRGEDHISNTPRQILIQEACGFPRPVYAHFPLHLAADRSKLSKRKGDVAVRSYREKGYLPEALFNYLAMLGWTPPSGREIMSVDEMTAEFDLHDLHKSAAVFDLEKLRWFNRQYLERKTDDAWDEYVVPVFSAALKERGLPVDERAVHRLVPLVRERISVADEIASEVRGGEFDFFFTDPQLAAERIPDKKSSALEAREHLLHARATLEKLTEWSAESTKGSLWDYATEHGRGAVLWPLRYALSGAERSPDPFSIAAIVGKEASLNRIQKAIDMLEHV